MGPVAVSIFSLDPTSLAALRLTLVARRDGVVAVVGDLGAADDVPPPGADLGAGGHGDDGVVLELEVLVAGEGGVVDILDRVVAGRRADALQLALFHTVDRHLLEDGMARGDSREAQDDREGLHDFVKRVASSSQTVSSDVRDFKAVASSFYFYPTTITSVAIGYLASQAPLYIPIRG